MKRITKTIFVCLLSFLMLSSTFTGALALTSENTNIDQETDCEGIYFSVIEKASDELPITIKAKFSQNRSIPALPADTEAYCYTCDTCSQQVASSTPRTLLNDGTYGTCIYSGCDDGKYIGYTMCAKEYFYSFKCNECDRKDDYDILPEGTSDAPYGVCKGCGKTATEDMFRIDYKFMQYKRPCFFCFKVQLGTKNVYDSPDCPYCGECYDIVLPESVDENGNLIYGGGGNNTYYCSQSKKFYQAPKNEKGDIIDDCPYCDNHSPIKITILYCTNCPSCGARAERIHIDQYKRPYLMATLNNIFMSIAVDISGNIDPDDFELTNRCYECKYNFSENNNLSITRHIDAPDGTVYESYPNDRDYHETDNYIENGSQYDNFFERLSWSINTFFRNIRLFFEALFNPDNM